MHCLLEDRCHKLDDEDHKGHHFASKDLYLATLFIAMQNMELIKILTPVKLITISLLITLGKAPINQILIPKQYAMCKKKSWSIYFRKVVTFNTPRFSPNTMYY
eukprot:TRINITY_DN5898_c0_g1_i1.p1 TRINITY_DN5898_c0_g1~~TRINITY_DN5898_c0_g1_i1.p1  ORF type:complete len:104 (-),score=3.54 TRINITY_DN5898_c0_g1_i1:18-329(-)